MTTDPYAAPVETHAAMPPAGWYPDPDGSGAHRWWDGTQWTFHRSDAHAATAPAASATATQATAGRRRASTGAIVGIVIGAVVLLAGLAIAAIVIAGGLSASNDAAPEPDAAPIATSTTEAAAEESTAEESTAEESTEADAADGDAADTPTDGTVSLAGGGYTLTLPDGWGVSPQAELMEGIFGTDGIVDFHGAWAPSDAFDADQLMVVSINVPGTTETIQGGFDGALATGSIGYDDVTAGEIIWTTTADGRALAYQTITAVAGDVTTTTAFAQMDADGWTVQITLATMADTDVTAMIETLAESVVAAP